MKKIIFASLLIFTSSITFADTRFNQTNAVLGQLLIMDAFSRVTEGKGKLNTPVANLEDKLKDFQILNPHKICYLSPQYHSDGTVTPRLMCQ